MTRLILLLFLSFSLVNSSAIDNKIKNHKQILNKNKSVQIRTDLQVKILAKQISNQNKELNKLESSISGINKDIKEHEKQLKSAKTSLVDLQNNSKSLIQEKKKSEEQIVKIIIEDFSSSIALKLADENTLDELIDSEVYKILSENSKDEILKLNNSYEILTQNKRENQNKIKKISDYIEDRKEKKKELDSLKDKYSKSLVTLERKHREYQKQLKKIISKQESLKDLLAKLNILKKEELEKERKRRLAAAAKKKRQKNKKFDVDDQRNNQYADDIDLDVRMIGSSTSGVKVSRYRGRKTIAPLDSFKVVKKFGKYYDPVYKIKLFNESIILKSNIPQAKVKSIWNGKIVYAKKDAGLLENVVIIQHTNGIHTIYSHLDKISPSLKVGRWIKQGYVVGRVNDSLTFQATKNEAHIDPKDLFKI